MKWDRKERKYWRVGERIVFRPSKQRSQDFLAALVICDGKIHDTFSLDVYDGAIQNNQKPHEIAVLFSISLPVGAESRFEEIMGGKCLEEPPVIHLNSLPHH